MIAFCTFAFIIIRMLALNGMKRALGPNVFNLQSFTSQSCQIGAWLKTGFQWNSEDGFHLSSHEGTLVLLSIFNCTERKLDHLNSN